jgi:hypothetical protein
MNRQAEADLRREQNMKCQILLIMLVHMHKSWEPMSGRGNSSEEDGQARFKNEVQEK